MILVNELKGRMVAKGLNQQQLARLIGVSDVTLQRKLKSGVFLSNEIETMIDLLDIKDPVAIFFAPNVASQDNQKGA